MRTGRTLTVFRSLLYRGGGRGSGPGGVLPGLGGLVLGGFLPGPGGAGPGGVFLPGWGGSGPGGVWSWGGFLPGPEGWVGWVGGLVMGGSSLVGGVWSRGDSSLVGGVCSQGGFGHGGHLPGPGVGSRPAWSRGGVGWCLVRHSPPVNRMTHTCKNITLAKTLFRPVIII